MGEKGVPGFRLMGRLDSVVAHGSRREQPALVIPGLVAVVRDLR
ncbi:MAG: hypothetical protein ABWY78_14940 [Microvirga sp.]